MISLELAEHAELAEHETSMRPCLKESNALPTSTEAPYITSVATRVTSESLVARLTTPKPFTLWVSAAKKGRF